MNYNAKKAKIILDPRLKYNYASFYLLGLYEVFGKNNCKWDITPFLSLSYETSLAYNSGLPFIFNDGEQQYKVFIDTEDQAKIEKDRYSWCDLYYKVNPLPEDVEKYSKLFAAGVSFGIQLTSKFNVVLHALCHYFQSRKHTCIPLSIYLRDYLYTVIRRRPIENYMHDGIVKPNYIFHASTLWYDNGTDGTTNKYRGEFLKACKAAGLEIEGGLYYIDTPDVIAQFPKYEAYKEQYSEFIYKKRLSMDQYLQKTKESLLVFNTPSVCACHGWKLGEYLCMGKAIISMPLTRVLPGTGLIHGENVHFVSSVDEILPAVQLLKNNVDYRKKLERGARQYYENYLAPATIITRCIQQVKQL